MFKSATIKLTGWYLSIIMFISISFSVLIFNIASHELDFRLERFQNTLNDRYLVPPPINGRALRNTESSEAGASIMTQLIYVNLFILIAGGFGSYFLARRTMRPIQESHEAQARFTSDASHELRTPLASMKTEIEVALRNQKSDQTELKNILKSNLEEVNDLSKLVETLLNMSRLEHAKLEYKSFNLCDTVSNVIDRLKLPAGRISLTKKSGLMINANKESLVNLLNILLDNALKYSPKDSKIVIDCSKLDSKVLIQISNKGPGIPTDKIPFIFDRFYRAESSHNKSAVSGYGLGLAIAKQIVSLHSGEISATSQENGVTTFKISLPIANKA